MLTISFAKSSAQLYILVTRRKDLFSTPLAGIGGQRVFIDKNGAAEVDLVLLDMRWEFTSTLILDLFYNRLKQVV